MYDSGFLSVCLIGVVIVDNEDCFMCLIACCGEKVGNLGVGSCCGGGVLGVGGCVTSLMLIFIVLFLERSLMGFLDMLGWEEGE